jgi:hypothetical protein
MCQSASLMTSKQCAAPKYSVRLIKSRSSTKLRGEHFDWMTFDLTVSRRNFLSISGKMGVCRSVTFKAPVRPFCEPRSHLQSGNAITGPQSRLDQRKQGSYLTNPWQIDCVFMPFVSQPCAIDSVDSFDRFSLVKSVFGGCR